MGVARSSRPSEETYTHIWQAIKNLTSCVWHPLPEAAIEIIGQIKQLLDKLETQLKEENPKSEFYVE